MKRKIVAATAVLGLGVQGFAAGYMIPEQSIASTAKAGASVAVNDGAETAYYNPAAMSWLEKGRMLEAGLTIVNSKAVEFDGSVYSSAAGAFLPASAESEAVSSVLPFFHYVAPGEGAWRWGASLTVPSGTKKAWDSPFQKAMAQEFYMSVVEMAPAVSYKIDDRWSVGGALRLIRASGTVRISSDALGYKEKTQGDTFATAVALAVSYRPCEEGTLALTYRSGTMLDLEGTAKGHLSAGAYPYNTDGSVNVPLPSVLTLAGAYTFGKTQVELTVERIGWSMYDELDFDFDDAVVDGALGTPIPKDWDDTTTVRLGVTHRLDDAWTLMAGLAKDPTPIPEETVEFSLPDSDGTLYALGAKYKLDDSWKIGAAYLLSQKADRKVSGTKSLRGIDGEFSSSASLLTFGAEYRF